MTKKVHALLGNKVIHEPRMSGVHIITHFDRNKVIMKEQTLKFTRGLEIILWSLLKKIKKKTAQELKASCISPEPTERDRLLKEIIERAEACDQTRMTTQERKNKKNKSKLRSH